MNGYQCYLRRHAKTLHWELEAARKLGYNLGVKLIRGAYMNEERILAETRNQESPIWDTLEETHKCYNDNTRLMLENALPNDCIFIATHNADTVDMAK